MKFPTQVQDFSVSGEIFRLQPNADASILQTLPVPAPEQIGKYYESDEYISHTDGNSSFFEKAYQFAKRIALQQKVSLVRYFATPTAKTHLDFGAGTGAFVEAMTQVGFTSLGYEPSANARANAAQKEIQLLAEYKDLAPAQFDIISLWHVLEHVYNPTETLTDLKKLLKDFGIIVIAVPNFESWDAQHYQAVWAAYDVPRHLWHFSEKGIRQIAQEVGLEVAAVKPMWMDAFYVALLSEKYRHGKHNWVRATLNGLKSNLLALFSKQTSSKIYILTPVSQIQA